MQFNSLLLASLVSLVSADFAADVTNVKDKANDLSSAVNAWDGQIANVAPIASLYAPLSQAVSALKGDTPSAGDVSGQAGGLTDLTAAVTNLLNELVSKADTFKSTGTDSIVKTDIDGLSQPSADIISALLSVNTDDAAKNSLKDGINGLGAAFSSAISVFGASAVAFPSV